MNQFLNNRRKKNKTKTKTKTKQTNKQRNKKTFLRYQYTPKIDHLPKKKKRFLLFQIDHIVIFH